MRKRKRKNRKSIHHRNKKRHSKTRLNQGQLGYDSLEERRLLATDILLGMTGSTFQTDSPVNPARTNAAIGPDHIVEILNGRFNVINRDTGVRVDTDTLNGFFAGAGATLFSDPINPKVIFDQASQRWFAAANGQGDGNWIYIAFTESADAEGPWQHLQFAADSEGIRFNNNVTLSVDADALYLTTTNSGLGGVEDVSIYSIPKSDIFAPDPTLTNMSRFENLDTAMYGRAIQVGTNFEPSDGKAVAISNFNASSVQYFEIMGADAPGATLSEPITVCIEVDCDEPLPYGDAQRAETPEDPILEEVPLFVETSSEITGNVVEANGGIWAAKTVYNADNELNMVAWFEISTEDGTKAQAGTIETIHHVHSPSFSINEYGIAAIAFNQSSLTELISSYSVVGITVNGLQTARDSVRATLPAARRLGTLQHRQ